MVKIKEVVGLPEVAVKELLKPKLKLFMLEYRLNGRWWYLTKVEAKNEKQAEKRFAEWFAAKVRAIEL